MLCCHSLIIVHLCWMHYLLSPYACFSEYALHLSLSATLTSTSLSYSFRVRHSVAGKLKGNWIKTVHHTQIRTLCLCTPLCSKRLSAKPLKGFSSLWLKISVTPTFQLPIMALGGATCINRIMSPVNQTDFCMASLSHSNRRHMVAETSQSVHCMRCRTVWSFNMRRNELASWAKWQSNDGECPDWMSAKDKGFCWKWLDSVCMTWQKFGTIWCNDEHYWYDFSTC